MKRKLLNKSSLPILIFFLIVFVMHLNMVSDRNQDDGIFCRVLDEWPSLWAFLDSRYHGWSSRMVIEAVLVVIARLNVNVWRILDSVVFSLGVYASVKLVNEKNDLYINIVGCAAFLLYHFTTLSSAGYIATTLNYLWPFCLGVFSFLPLIYTERGQKPHWMLYVVCVLCLAYGLSQEQMCAIIFAFHLLCFLRGLLEGYRSKYNIGCLLFSAASIVFILTCPGNHNRLEYETSIWYPEYAEVTIWGKLYLGVVHTVNYLVEDKTILLALCVVLVGTVFVYAKRIVPKVAAVILMAVVCGITVLKSLLLSVLPSTTALFDILEYSGVPGAETPIYQTLFVFAFSCALLLCIGYLLFTVFGIKQLLPQFVFLGGVCSSLIMGWTPTVFVSGERTAIFLFMGMLIVCIFLIYKLYTDGKLYGQYRILPILLPAYKLARAGIVMIYNLIMR